MSFVSPSEVRKGAWSQEEDGLLRNCIQANGEGNWHQVPKKAGLNRCRKSCRLRWLNYLKPNLKRGEFEEDEVDLLLKLHKLLGNRWAMISKRLPGRTANDVKNYWNTHLAKKMTTPANKRSSSSTRRNGKPASNGVRVQAIRPQARTFKNLLWQRRGTEQAFFSPSSLNSGRCNPPPPPPPPLPPPIVFPAEYESSWWESLLADNVHEGALSLQGNSDGNGRSFEDTLRTRSGEDHLKCIIGDKLGFDLELWDLI